MTKLKSFSKFLHICLLLSCFLPAITPSCSGEKKSGVTTVDSTASVIEHVVDTTLSDSINTAPAPLQSETYTSSNYKDEPSEDKSLVSDSSLFTEEKILTALFKPDNSNLSIFGFVYFNFTSACLVIFFVLSCFSSWLRFKSKDEVLQRKVALFALVSLSIFSIDYHSDIVWGFWIAYVLSGLIVFINFILTLKQKNQPVN